jgi:predicted ATPase
MDGGEVRHFERAIWAPSSSKPPDLDSWPFTIPAVAQLIREEGLDIPPGITFLVGENGSGKSTLVEALAARYWLHCRRGFLFGGSGIAGPGGSQEDSDLQRHLRARTHPQASPAGFFLRAEAMHSYLSEADSDPSAARVWGGEKLQTRSHGESFLAVLRHRFADVGVYFMDEPEAALSFRSVLGLMWLLDLMRREGSQVVIATHSPMLVSLPGAHLIELDEDGMRQVDAFEDLELVRNWRGFLDEPDRYLRHLLTEESEPPSAG